MANRPFTSESVTEGHPDKIADRISDTVVDALIAQDPYARVAVETLITTGQVHVVGEVSTHARTDIADLVRNKILEIGYDHSTKGFDGASCGVSVSIGAQSPDIAQGVDIAYEKRVHGDDDWLGRQGAGDQGLMFGYAADIGTYGGMARHGGGAFSGKDPSKVDRSAASAMRWVAKNVVAAGFARRCEAQVAYAIGKARPVGLFVETFGTATVGQDVLEKAIDETFDLRPGAIIRDLKLLRPIYAQTAAYGHFGRELPDFTWELTDRVGALRAAAGG